MAKMNDRVKELFEKVRTAVLSTATPDGQPNAVPIGAMKILDDETILVSDQFFNKTRANLETNPRVGVTFWEKQEGYQLKGTATIETEGPRFEETARWIEELGQKIGAPLKSKGAVIIRLEGIYDIAPGPNAGRQLA